MTNTIYIDEQLIQQADQILERIGLDTNTAIKMTLKRIIRDGGISFLVSDFPKAEMEPETVIAPSITDDGKITKNIAVNLFKSKGYDLGRNTTFASKNKVSNYYWANPLFESLNQDWYLILNDWHKNELHLFQIPAHTLKETDLVRRADNDAKIDLQITYNDITFTDNRSKVNFANFFKESISY